MTQTTEAATELISPGAIREVLQSRGPCLTMVLPAYRPGAATGSLATLLKTAGHDVSRKLADLQYSKDSAASLIRPIEQLAEDAAFLKGSHWGRAIFRAPNVFEQFQLTQILPLSVTVAGSFAIRNLLPELNRPSAFYILALSKERVDVLRCAGLHAEAVKLPRVPETLAEALDLEPPDHDLENRSAAGTGAGAMHRIRFGTGSGREQRHGHLADFYRIVDRGIHELLRDPEAPLVLAGVDEETDSYRAVSAYRNLATGNIAGSPHVASQQAEMIQQAYALLRADAVARDAQLAKDAKERSGPERFSTNLDTILKAAFDGRVAHLFVNETAERIGVAERGTYQSWGEEDLLNLAAVQALIHHGKVSGLPGEMFPDESPAAAVLRF